MILFEFGIYDGHESLSVIEFVQDYRSIHLTYLNIQSFLSQDGVTAIFMNVGP